MKNLLFVILSLLSAGLVFNACDPKEPAPSIKSNVETIRADADLSTFLAAIERSALTARLDSANTVFAPNNAAFTSFLNTNGYTRLEDVPVADLKQLLLYHLNASILRAENVPEGYYATQATFQGNALRWHFRTVGSWMVNGIPVLHGGIQTTNGLVYVIERVIALPTVVSMLQLNPDFSSFVLALTRPDLGIDYLTTLADGPFTVFVPTNEAFDALFSELGYANLDAVPTDVLNAVLQYHVAPGVNLTDNDLFQVQEVSTLGGKKFTINTDHKPTDNLGRSASLLQRDIQTKNGVVHSMDKVLRPN